MPGSRSFRAAAALSASLYLLAHAVAWSINPSIAWLVAAYAGGLGAAAAAGGLAASVAAALLTHLGLAAAELLLHLDAVKRVVAVAGFYGLLPLPAGALVAAAAAAGGYLVRGPTWLALRRAWSRLRGSRGKPV